MKTNIFLITALSLLFQVAIAKDNVSLLKKTIQLEDEDRLQVSISFAAGKLFIHPGKPGELFKGELNFIDEEPIIEYSSNRNSGVLEITTPGFSDKDDEETNLKFNNISDLKKNTWHLYFSPDIPIEFTIEIGAAKNKFDFGGLQIADLKISTGASDTYFDFSEPNKIEMERMYVEAGVSKIKGNNLLNGNFKKFRFDGGVGDYDFFFTGKLNQTPRIDIDTGVASTRLIIERETGFKVRINGSFLSSINIEGAEEEEDDYWVSDNYNRNRDYLNISSDIGVGSFKVQIIDK